jgi:hypothetical protein
MAMHLIDLARDVQDRQLLDQDGEELGRVDAVVLELRDGEPPRVDHLELGFVSLASRLHPRLEAMAMALHKRWSVRRSARFGVPWSAVTEVTKHHIEVKLCAEETPAFDWEKWLRKHVVSKLPGGQEQ